MVSMVLFVHIVPMMLSLAAAAVEKRPNFLFMLADDWGWGDVGAYGADQPFAIAGTNTRTPTLDALAANGTLFTDFHTGQSFCAPSRTAFMTGKFPADLSVNTNWNTGNAGAVHNHKAGLPYQLPTPKGEGPSPFAGGLTNIAHLMQQAGYATAHYGKWHLGGCSPKGQHTPAPSEYGFDRTGTYGSPVFAGCVKTPKDEPAAKTEIGDPWWSADVGDYIRDSGIAFMNKSVAAGKPFYLHLWWHMSHDTIDPRPEQYNETFPYKTTCLFPAKAACQASGGGNSCEPCDWQVFWGAQTYSDTHRFSRVVAAVDELGIRDNTYIVFSTDNGAQAERWTNGKGGSGLHGDTGGAFSNAVGVQGPFRGCKGSLYEGGHRVPFIVTGPGVPRGRVDHSIISAVDWLPTVTSIAGVSTPPGALLRGEDMSRVWHGEMSHYTNRSKKLIWRGGGGPAPCWNRSPHLAIRDGDWKLLFSPPQTDSPDAVQLIFPSEHSQGPETIVQRVELYNVSVAYLPELSGTFFEAQNEAKNYPEVVAALSKEALEWHDQTPCPFNIHSMKPASGANKCKSIAPAGCQSYRFPSSKK